MTATTEDTIAGLEVLRAAWTPEYDDRVRPLLLKEASRREAMDWRDEDAENVIAFLLSRLDSAPTLIAEQGADKARIAALEEALGAHNVVAANGDVIGIADQLEAAADTLKCFVDADEEAEPNGLRDCTDNDGFAYQSESMSGLMDHADLAAADLRKWATTLRATIAGAKA